MNGVKHLIECHCILPQYKNREKTVFHKFPVFSVLDESDTVIPKTVQCNNCGAIHKVVDICRSEIEIGKDESLSIKTAEDIRINLPDKISEVLKSYDCDLPTHEEAEFIVDYEKWGSSIILTKEDSNGEISGKKLFIYGPGLLKIEPFGGRSVVFEGDFHGD